MAWMIDSQALAPRWQILVHRAQAWITRWLICQPFGLLSVSRQVVYTSVLRGVDERGLRIHPARHVILRIPVDWHPLASAVTAV